MQEVLRQRFLQKSKCARKVTLDREHSIRTMEDVSGRVMLEPVGHGDGGSSSSRTITLNTQPELQGNSLDESFSCVRKTLSKSRPALVILKRQNFVSFFFFSNLQLLKNLTWIVSKYTNKIQ